MLVRSDFFTRLLFTEPEFMKRPVTVGTQGPITVEDAFRTHRLPDDAFWSMAGLPGIPLAIGVNASLRSSDGTMELLAHKNSQAQGDMADTVGPPVSAGALPKFEALDPNGLTLGKLVDECMRTATERELSGLPIPELSRHAAWLDSGRGFKPEVNFRATIAAESILDYQDAVCMSHAGCVTAQGHLDSNGHLSVESKKSLDSWGLNFQAWFLW
ncbi:hypothetical protein ASL20_09755 [Cupriavidus necator]|nr:hypothetical protein ASL20_09755 [Cupriavidus necator]